MIPLKIEKPVLIGKQHLKPGDSAEVEDNRARSLVASGHASIGPRVEVATRIGPPRKAARLTGKAE